MRVGDEWAYSGFSEDQGKQSRAFHHAVRIVGTNKAGELVVRHRNPTESESQQYPVIRKPLPVGSCVGDVEAGIEILSVDQCSRLPEIGSRWTREYPSKDVGATIRMDIHYIGIESVTARAGTFNAYRFEAEQRIPTADGEIRWQKQYWYAPEVRGMIAIVSQRFDHRGKAGAKFITGLDRFVPGP